MSLINIINIGPKLSSELEEVGIYSLSDLSTLGSLKVFILIVEENGEGCYNKLYALEGAIQGIRWHDLDHETKDQLKSAYRDYLLQ